jgi:hypothetical protein
MPYSVFHESHFSQRIGKTINPMTDRRHPAETAKMDAQVALSAATIRNFGSMSAIPPVHAPRTRRAAKRREGDFVFAWQKNKEVGRDV